MSGIDDIDETNIDPDIPGNLKDVVQAIVAKSLITAGAALIDVPELEVPRPVPAEEQEYYTGAIVPEGDSMM